MKSHDKKGAILYDFLLVNGGAEQVTLSLAKEFSCADLCVASCNPLVIQDETLTDFNIIDLGAYANSTLWRIIKTLYTFSVKTSFLKNYDWVLYSGNYAPTAIYNHAHGLNILYCHTIPRYVYDLRYYYLNRYSSWQGLLLKILMSYVKKEYESAINNMDLIIANSKNVQNRISHYLKKDSIVIYPPCDVDQFFWLGQQDFYLSLARLECFKRVDVIIEAFKSMPNKRLVIVSGGNELDYLKRLTGAADNIYFTGWLDQERLRTWIGQAIATIYIPMNEDFGMSPVESMAAGKPVIGVAEGGLLETVIDGETGLLLPPNPTPTDITEALQILTPERALQMRGACEMQAQLFRKEIFLGRIREILF